jgi:hypothetical protein
MAGETDTREILGFVTTLNTSLRKCSPPLLLFVPTLLYHAELCWRDILVLAIPADDGRHHLTGQVSS